MLISKWGAKRKRDGAEQPASPAQPPSGKRTRRAAQPASRKIAFVFSGAWPADVEKKHEVRQNFLRGLRTALDPDPDVVAVCFPHRHALLETESLIEMIAQELAHWSMEGKARPVRKRSFVSAVMCFYFSEDIANKEIEPEESVPALLISLEGLTAVAASWPNLPLRAAKRLLAQSVEDAQQDASRATQPALIAIAAQVPGFKAMSIDNIARGANCIAHFDEEYNTALFLHPAEAAKPRPLTSDDPRIFLVKAPDSAAPPSPVPAASSAAQPACLPSPAPAASSAAQPARLRLRARTPLYDSFLESIQSAEDQEASDQILDFYQNECFYGEFRFYTDDGERTPGPCSFSWKMELLMQKVLALRSQHIERLVQAHTVRPWNRNQELCTRSFSSDELTHIMNVWRDDIDSWMRPGTRRRYNRTWRYQIRHQIKHRAFHAYQMQMSGCKFMLRQLIALPLICPPGVAQPIHGIRRLVTAWEEHRESPEYAAAVNRSEKRVAGRQRLSKRLREAQAWYNKGAQLSRQVKDDRVSFDDLDEDSQRATEDYDARRSARRLDELLEEHAAVEYYPGAGVFVLLSCAARASVAQP